MKKYYKRFRLSILLPFAALAADGPVDFHRDIEPIFKEHCIDCHGPEKQKSELRIDQRPSLLRGGDSGLASLVPGASEKSFIIEAIKGIDPDALMPPKGDPLTKDQITLIEKWITEGAEWPGQMDAKIDFTSDFWSLQPVVRPEVPKAAKAANPVDAFLLEKLAGKKLGYNPPADPRSLIRRTAVLLTGLPPPPDRVATFIADYEADADQAFHALVEELLASPHFGERWAQHWLDVIRWAETNGSEANLYRKNAWIYRDYVVRAFNQDIPYDQFVREQLAGDQLGMGEATGFLVAGPHVPAATVGREPTAIRQARADRMDEIMQTVGASMLGMTVSCARCHNHKFDPITIKDYYSLTAVFQGVEFGGRYPEYAAEHPRKQRADELYKSMWKKRSILRKDGKVWVENWGAYQELHFPPQVAQKVRVVIDSGWGRFDEIEFLGGPTKTNTILSQAADGTTVVEGDNQVNAGSPVQNVIDGQYGTMGWSVKGIKGRKMRPYAAFTFSQPQEIGRLRLSNNREYYYDTDYLEAKGPKHFPEYRVEVLDESGKWKTIAGSKMALQQLGPPRKAALEGVQETIALLMEEGPRTSFVGRWVRPVVTHVLHRGSPESPRDEVMPSGFEFLEGDLGLNRKTSGQQRRLEFAEWLTRPEHPLTARVMVNRVWHHIFGTGIVATTADFGVAGAPPSHPELLDWLTAEWVHPEQVKRTPWSMKDLMRQILFTDAFRQSSAPREDGLGADSAARALWRFPPRRMEAEVIRDGILQASGKLDLRLGGRSYRIHNVKKTYAQWEVVDNHGEDTWRRMLYQERMRRVDDRIFTAFDFPDCGQVRDKRPVSTTPLQALNLMNSPFAIEQSAFVAARAERKAGADEGAAVDLAFELLLGRMPDADERSASIAVMKESGLDVVCRSIINANEFAFIP